MQARIDRIRWRRIAAARSMFPTPFAKLDNLLPEMETAMRLLETSRWGLCLLYHLLPMQHITQRTLMPNHSRISWHELAIFSHMRISPMR